jgi:hypothetical protein
MANKLDFATMLLEEGLAMVNLPAGSKQIIPNLDKM